MANEDAATPQEPANSAATGTGLSDEIGGDELAALLGQQPAAPAAAPTPAPAPAAPAPAPTPAPDSDSFGDEISEEELLALQVASGGKLGKPKPAGAPAAPAAAPAPTMAPPRPAPAPDVKPKAEANAFRPVTPVDVAATYDAGMSLLMDVPLRVSVELGRISMTLQEVLELGRGSIIELERLAGEPVDILVNDKLIGHGEVVVVDEYFGVKITELIGPKG